MACHAGRIVSGIGCSIVAGKAAAWKARTAPEGTASAVASDKVQSASGTHAVIRSIRCIGRIRRIGRIPLGRSCCLSFRGPCCLVRCAVIRKRRTHRIVFKIREGNVVIRHGAGLPFLKFRQGHIVKPGRRHVVWLLALCGMWSGRRYSGRCKRCCKRRIICPLLRHGICSCRGRGGSSRCLSRRARTACLSLPASSVPCIAAGRKGRAAVKFASGAFAQYKLAAASGTAQG